MEEHCFLIVIFSVKLCSAGPEQAAIAAELDAAWEQVQGQYLQVDRKSVV